MTQLTPEQQAFANRCEQFREPARSKMLALIPRIDGHEHSTFGALAGDGPGKPDQIARIGLLFKEGLFVRRADNTFGWPDARTSDQVMTEEQALSLLNSIKRVGRWYHTLPEGELRWITGRLFFIAHQAFHEPMISVFTGEVMPSYYEQALLDEKEDEALDTEVASGHSQFSTEDVDEGDETEEEYTKKKRKKNSPPAVPWMRAIKRKDDQ